MLGVVAVAVLVASVGPLLGAVGPVVVMVAPSVGPCRVVMCPKTVLFSGGMCMITDRLWLP